MGNARKIQRINSQFTGGIYRYMKLFKLMQLFAPVAFLLTASVGQASLINGSLPLNGGGLVQDGADLSVSTTISGTTLLNLSLGSGDYAFIPAGTNFGVSTLDYTNAG